MQLTPYGLNRFLLVTRDVTQIEKLETTRKDFVANVPHELSTPLTVLGGFLETLQDMPADALSDEQHHRNLRLRREKAQRMQDTVSDLMTFMTIPTSPRSEERRVRKEGANRGRL